LVLAAHGEITAAIDTIGRALEEHEVRPVPFEIGRTLLEKGRLQRRAKQKAAAKQSLELALATLEPLEAALLADQARDELGRIGLRRPSRTGGVTQAQTRVLELLTSGMSNREIAAALYMSERSVESHLTKLYREHGVRSRAQLLATLGTRAVPSGHPGG
jgi:DNA-binding NarL/FixJ family response regulator